MRKIENIGFAGLGLIGGTIARAIRNVYPDSLICAYDPDLAALRESRFDGVIDRALGSVEELASCDLIFFCAPVALNCENMAALAPFVKEEMILTDVSSVKGSIHKAVRGLGLSGHFIGGHPMTGSERTGYRNSDPALLENAYYPLPSAMYPMSLPLPWSTWSGTVTVRTKSCIRSPLAVSRTSPGSPPPPLSCGSTSC